MKTILTLCVLLSVIAVHAAAPVVEVKDTGNTYVDGVNVGQPVDAIANNPAIASSIQTALTKFVTKLSAEQAAATKAAQDSAAAQVAAKEEAIASEVETLRARIAELEAEVAALKEAAAKPVE